MRYRRAYQPGATYFFTLACHQRQPVFADADRIARLGLAFRHVRKSRPFITDAIVVLPDHLHTLWTLPAGDTDFSTRWRLIKQYVQRGVRERLWQLRFWEHLIRDEQDYRQHIDYIHMNPVKHGLVDRPMDWPHSSFHRWMKKGAYSADWCDPSINMNRE